MSATAALPAQTIERLQTYATLLATWTRRINLIAPADIPHIWPRHIEDSLRLLPLISPGIPPGAARAIDLGSGAGLPGLVLAIATGIPFDLVEADQRKAAFLREAARLTAAPATIYPVRIETCTLPPAPLVTARALAPLSQLLPLAAPLLAPGGRMLFPKGARAAAEIAAARETWSFTLETHGAEHPVLAITAPTRLRQHA